MPITAEWLDGLLPAAMRAADERAGGVLRALLEVLAPQFDALDADIEQLGENWFVETCAAWAVPYIGDLLGERPAAAVDGLATPRARVANAIAYRRRAGTVAVLEALTRDTTGWPTRAREYFRVLAATQHLGNVRPDRPGQALLRDGDALELIGGPFDGAPRTVDVRRIGTATGTGRARHGIAGVGLHTYRLAAYWLPRATAVPAAGPADGRYHVDPLGRDLPLFNRAAPEATIDDLATEPQLPAPLRRRPLHAELDALRADLAAGRPPSPRWFGARPPLRVYRADPGGAAEEVPAERLDICHLGDLDGPPGWRRPAAGMVAVDPVLGRVAFPAGDVPERVLVSSAFGFSGEVGAGPYDRSRDLAARLDRPVTWQIGVSRDLPAVPGVIVATIGEAIAAWNAQPDGTVGLIALMDSHVFAERLTGPNRARVGEGSLLAIVAAGWPELPGPDGEGAARRPGRIVPAGLRPVLLGDLELAGTAPDGSLAPGEALLDGLLVTGRVAVTGGGDLGRLTLAHCTLDPAGGGLTAGGGQLDLVADRCLLGPVALAADVPSLTVSASVVDAGGAAAAISAPGAVVTVDGVTVLGPAEVRQVEASGSIFTAPLTALRAQAGCVRFSFVAPGSRTPGRYRCQPDGAIAADPGADPAAVAARTAPSFTSTRPGRPGYAQLGPCCPPEITRGAEDGSELGAFAFLHGPQRVSNLLASLDEYLRFGLDAALIPET